MSITQYLQTKTPAKTKKTELMEAAGILKHYRNLDPVKYQKQIRAEWEKRLKRLFKK